MTRIRPAQPSDARQLCELAEATFRDAFGLENTAADMDLHCRTNYGEAIQAGEIARPDMLTLLAEEDGRLAGFAQLRRGDAPGCVTGLEPGEIQRLYVVRDRHGKGVAQALSTRASERCGHAVRTWSGWECGDAIRGRSRFTGRLARGAPESGPRRP
ncbi:GNAT family N-acetyltransferase [Frateuria sp. MAH-13]|uniref:GNAT family N-acetyltransferase n=1 Tax=Frateuria flava TaxID=2821489 RepID=A0ABS4DQJ5_9GAMM|nr:GNAT family N-acetyltransferase [Frateuria flava]